MRRRRRPGRVRRACGTPPADRRPRALRTPGASAARSRVTAVEVVAEHIADQVQPEDHECEADPGVDREQGLFREIALRLAEHHTVRRGRWLDAEAEE